MKKDDKPVEVSVAKEEQADKPVEASAATEEQADNSSTPGDAERKAVREKLRAMYGDDSPATVRQFLAELLQGDESVAVSAVVDSAVADSEEEPVN